MTALAALMVVLLSSPAPAQQVPIVHIGDRMRAVLRGRDGVAEGDLARIDHDSMSYRGVCRECADGTVARDAVLSIELRLPRTGYVRHTFAGMTLGALIGGAVGVIAGAAAGGTCHGGPCGAGIIIMTPVGAAIGAGTGGLVGIMTTPERWVAAQLPPDD